MDSTRALPYLARDRLGEIRLRSVRELSDLRGRVAAVVGGAGHIGRTAAGVLAELGARVAVIDVDTRGARQVAEDLERRHGAQSTALDLDLADETSARATPARVAEALGGLDILMNVAALVGTTPLPGWTCAFEQQSAETWRRALEVNLTGPFVLVQAAVPFLARSGHGSIINVGSIYGIVGGDPALYVGTSMGQPAAYAASKGGLLQLTRWLATMLAPRIRVNAISPGGVWRSQPEVFRERYEARTPLARMAVEEDLAGAVAFLASDLSAYVTGQNVVVDGGFTAW